MKLKTKYIFLIVCVLICFGCSTAALRGGTSTILTPPDKGQVWQLVNMRGRDVKRGTMVTLTLNPETGNLHGKAHCNSYYATFRMTPGSDCYNLTISGLDCDEVSCPDAVMNAEFRYLSLLAKADVIVTSEYTMTLYSKGKEILKYELQ